MKIKTMAGAAAGLVSTLMLVGGLLYSCGGSGSGIPSGPVALFLTDDISDFQQVTATVNRVDLIHTGTNASCNVFTGPVTVDITNLSGVMQLISLTNCAAGPYNRIHIEFAKSVTLSTAATTSTCIFASYKDSGSKPNALSCGPDACTLDINGAVNVLAGGNTSLALDFDLKNFDVSGMGTAACSVTMKVSPLNASDMQGIKHEEAMTGLVSGLSTTNKTFTLTRGNASFTVLYSGITATSQPGLDTLLERAQSDQLRTRVRAASIDLAGMTITASSIEVKVEGTIEGGSLDTTAKTFDVRYAAGGTSKLLGVDYSKALVEGTLAEGQWIDVKLFGYDGARFLARKVEAEAAGTMTED
ncbi:MAG: DUF4382 domain-containing protein [Nitrospiraceae bacterium]|nr:DUF4382 domain-containing protein [Nitrospiraceae bacterium]